MRTLIMAGVLVAAGLSMVAAQGGGVSVDGWQARLDRAGADVNELRFMSMGDGFHVTTGPHAIFWDPRQTASGSYTLSATFAQTKPSSHPNSFGLLFGGQDLDGAGQTYSYFLIREDGQFLVKTRRGDQTEDVTDGWARHEAVLSLDANGRARNALTVEVGAAEVRFLSNGTALASVPRGDLPLDGIVGVRFSHQLDVHVSGFSVD